MAPSLRHGQLIFGYNTRKFAVGDIVVVRHDSREKIKRIAQKAEDKVYLRGDNLGGSTDSRHFGWLSSSRIIAKVIWPRQNKRMIVGDEESMS